MEIKITVNVGPDTYYSATFHPGPQPEREPSEEERRETAVESGTSQVAPGLAISFPPAPVSLPL